MRAPHELQSFGFGQWENAEIKSATGFIDGNAVDDDFVVTRIAASHEERGQASTAALRVNDGAGQKAKNLVSRHWLHHCELGGAE